MSNETYAIKGAQIKEVIDHLECGFDDDSDAMTVLMLQSLPELTGEPVCWLVETEEDPELGILPFTTIADDTHETIRAMLNAFPVYTHAQPLPKGEPKAWLINFKDTDGTQRSRSYMHNAIGDYRQIDPNATSEELFTHAQLQPKGDTK